LILPLIAYTYGLARGTALRRMSCRERSEGSAVADEPTCIEKYSAVL
jgi:hypothetical protein